MGTGKLGSLFNVAVAARAEARGMRKTVVLVAATAMIAALAAEPAAANVHPRVAGLDCGALARSVGPGNVWRAYFYGEKVTAFDHRWPFSDAPCFRSQTDCRNWLYWAQTDYPFEQDVRWCHRGIG